MTAEILSYTFPVKDFGRRLRTLREQRGLTQRDLGRLAKIDVMLVSRYERGIGYPAVETVVALASALEVSLDYLLLGKMVDTDRPHGEQFRHVLLAEKLRQVDRELGRKEIEAVLGFLDAYLAKNRIKKLVNE